MHLIAERIADLSSAFRYVAVFEGSPEPKTWERSIGRWPLTLVAHRLSRPPIAAPSAALGGLVSLWQRSGRGLAARNEPDDRSGRNHRHDTKLRRCQSNDDITTSVVLVVKVLSHEGIENSHPRETHSGHLTCPPMSAACMRAPAAPPDTSWTG